MSVKILYHPKSDHASAVERFQRDFEHQTGKDVELVSLETYEGAQTAKSYDITQYPAILATTQDGAFLKMWQGDNLPLINDVNGYA